MKIYRALVIVNYVTKLIAICATILFVSNKCVHQKLFIENFLVHHANPFALTPCYLRLKPFPH